MRFDKFCAIALGVSLTMFPLSVASFGSGNTMEQSCADLLVDWNNFTEDLKREYGPERYKEIVYGPNPVTKVLDEYLANFEGTEFEYQRIRHPLRAAFQSKCLGSDLPESPREPADMLVGELLELAIASYKLDRSKPKWGLVELPQINFNEQSVQEVFKEIETSGMIVLPTLTNDLIGPAMSIYGQEYHLVTRSDFQNFNRLFAHFFNDTNAGTLSSETLAKDVLEQAAEELGLERK